MADSSGLASFDRAFVEHLLLDDFFVVFQLVFEVFAIVLVTAEGRARLNFLRLIIANLDVDGLRWLSFLHNLVALDISHINWRQDIFVHVTALLDQLYGVQRILLLVSLLIEFFI